MSLTVYIHGCLRFLPSVIVLRSFSIIHGAVQTVDVTAEGVPGLVAKNRGPSETFWSILDLLVFSDPVSPILSKSHRAGLTLQSVSVRRKPNAFNLLWQMKLVRGYGDAAGFEQARLGLGCVLVFCICLFSFIGTEILLLVSKCRLGRT